MRLLSRIVLGGAISTSFFVPHYAHWMFGLSIGLLALSIAIGEPRMPRRAPLVAVGVITVSMVAAVPLSIINGGFWPGTTILAFWMVLMAGLFAGPVSSSILPMLVSASLVQAAATIAQGLIHHGQGLRQYGLMSNPNPAAGLMAVGAIYLLTTKRYRPLAIPLLVALPLSGSRWGVAVASVVLVAMLVARAVPWKAWVAILGCSVVLTVPFWADLGHSLLGRGTGSAELGAIAAVEAEAFTRLSSNVAPQPLPRGISYQYGAHSAPVRVGIEGGILSALAWLFLSGYAIWRGHGAVRWLAIALLGLSMLDYYTWQPYQLSMVWWLVIGISARKNRNMEARHGS